MKHFILLSILILLNQISGLAQNPDKTINFLVSSDDPDHDAGIAIFEFNYQTKSLRFIKEFDAVEKSSYLAISHDNQYVYSVAQKKGEFTGTISSFYLLDNGQSLDLVNERDVLGAGPCYVSIDESGRFVMVANYVEGNVTAFELFGEGLIGKPVANIYHMGMSINKERQEGPHPHMIVQQPGTNRVFVPDLGTDKVMIYQLEESGNLFPGNDPYLKVAPGLGPRHVAFHPSGRFGFVLNELMSSVTSFSIDSLNGSVSEINTQSILPEDFTEFNKSADIHITHDGKFLYASNRGHNSLALLTVDQETGKISFEKTFDSGGDWPRAFRIDPTGKFLFVANKNSGNIVVFEIDNLNGNLIFVSENDKFPGPQCIKFIH